MKTLGKTLLVVGGILFWLQIIGLSYVWIVDPFQVRPVIDLLWDARQTEPVNDEINAETSVEPYSVEVDSDAEAGADNIPLANSEPVDKNPLLTEDQEQQLETVGIDPAALPQTITPAMVECAEGILGSARVIEIQAGATPTLSEFIEVRQCL